MHSDAVLLLEYSRTRDAEAFAELVRRHAPLVYGTCLRVLNNAADAEDIAQECFLDLARNAGSIRTSLAGWLHAVARNRSLKLIRKTAVRLRLEREFLPEPLYEDEPSWAHIEPLLDDALAELPDSLRHPIILHYLEGRTQEEVARELGINQSTVSRRQQKGLKMLRKKLTHAGVTTPIMLLAIQLAQNASAIPIPPSLSTSLGKLSIAGIAPGASAAAGAGSATAAGISVAAALKIALVLAAVALLPVAYFSLNNTPSSPAPAHAAAGEVQFGHVNLLSTNTVGTDDFDNSPAGAADGHGNWVVAWASRNSLGGTIGEDDDLLVTCSTDDGANWSNPVPLNITAFTDSDTPELTHSETSARIETDRNGVWVATWRHGEATYDPDLHITSEIQIARSTNAGASWSNPVTISIPSQTENNFIPDLATDRQGNWVVVWHNAFDEGTGKHMRLMMTRSSDNGITWSQPQIVAERNGDHDFGDNPRITVDGSGKWKAIWQPHTNGLWIHDSTDGGATWSPGERLPDWTQADRNRFTSMEIASGGLQNWGIAYSRLGEGLHRRDQILVSQSPDGGQNWLPRIDIAANLPDIGDFTLMNDASVAMDDSGVCLAAWYYGLARPSSSAPDGPFSRIHYAASFDYGVTWSEARPLTPQPTTELNTETGTCTITDGHGRWLVAWVAGPESYSNGGDVYYAFGETVPAPAAAKSWPRYR